MRELHDVLERWRADGEPVALATVIRVEGSVPRPEGAKLLVSGGGRIEGSVSGGCVEGAVAEKARGVLASGKPVIERYGINRNMMWDVGLSCGGAIDVFIQPLAKEELLGFEPGTVLLTVVDGPSRVGERLQAVPRDGGWDLRGSLGSPEADAELAGAASAAIRSGASRTRTFGDYDVFVDPQVPQPRLIIVGAVHIAVALCEFAARAGFAVAVIDPRERLNNRERFPSAAQLLTGWPEDELPALQLDIDTYVAVLTHDEKFDDPTLDFVLRRGVRYVGAIGSKKTQALRRQRLIDAGIPIATIDTLHAPIGLDIGAETPEEIALAILAEMIAEKYQHGGAPLRDRAAAHIHA